MSWLGGRSLRRGTAVDAARDSLDAAIAAAEFVPCRDGHLPKSAWDEGAPDHLADAAEAACVGGCPAQSECLFYALVAKEPDGIWGGVRARKRRDMQVSHYQ